MNQLVRLIYISHVKSGVGPDDIRSIISSARGRNVAAGITGLLVYNAEHFMQVLEGARDVVCHLYHRIVSDPRHTDVALLAFSEVDERRFDEWTMGFLPLTRETDRVLLKYTSAGTLDDRALTGVGALGMMTELSFALRGRLLSATEEMIATEPMPPPARSKLRVV